MKLIRSFFIVKEIDMIPIESESSSIKIKNKIFSKVSRIFAHSTDHLLNIFLDINTEIYPLCNEDKLDIMIFKPIQAEYKDNGFKQNWEEYFGKNLLDLFEYVVYGTIFHSGIEHDKFFVYASYGGLLMKLFGTIEKNLLEEFSIDSKILLLVKKV